MRILDPFKFKDIFWPDITFYDKQKEIVRSVQHVPETFVVAGNALGKDFIAAFIALWWFCSRRPARVVTTAVTDDQLDRVLWGEIRNWIKTAEHNLPLQYNHKHIRQKRDNGDLVPLTELDGQVCRPGAGETLLGRHLSRYPIPRCLVIGDEASGLEDTIYNSTLTWSHHRLFIGNAWDCENFFRKAVEEGNQCQGGRLYRNVIRIRAVDSPNIQRAVQLLGVDTVEQAVDKIKEMQNVN